MTYDETRVVATIERLTGRSLRDLAQEELDGADQYHVGGPDAVDRLLPALALGPGMTALDVGSGLGGPARQIARATGCAVVGVDIAPEYVAAATDLTREPGVRERVGFVAGPVAELARDGFDAACTLHVQMNVPDKRTFYTDIARHLRPGARLAVFEVCRGGAAEPPLPLPWSLDGTDSFLATPDELHEAIAGSGFETLEWVDDSAWAVSWYAELGRRMTAGPRPILLPALLSDGPTRLLNYAVALNEGAVTVHRGTFALRAG